LESLGGDVVAGKFGSGWKIRRKGQMPLPRRLRGIVSTFLAYALTKKEVIWTSQNVGEIISKKLRNV